MEISEIKKLTAYPDVNDVLVMLTEGVVEVVGDNLVGLYLTGSLTYGDFDSESSDIDFLTVMKQPLSSDKLEQIKNMHKKIGKAFPKWSKRIEGSYITTAMLSEALPPKKPITFRPYFNGGNMHDYQYGNEWTINLFVLYECGTSLAGVEPKSLIKSVSIEAVREASKRDLYEEWIPKISDDNFFKNSHYKAYLVLTLCRILYRASHTDVASKKVSSTWAKKELGKPWSQLIEEAENWKHGKEMGMTQETKEFIRFVGTKIK